MFPGRKFAKKRDGLESGVGNRLFSRARTGCGSILAEFPMMHAGTALSQLVTRFWAEWDINMHTASGLSRETPTHEYGHWVMCQMMREYAYAQMPWIIDRLMLHSMKADATEYPDFYTSEEVDLTEGWADFFASQVAGGTDYFGMHSGSRRVISATLPGWAEMSTGWYCDEGKIFGANGAPCLEDNVGAASYHAQFLEGTADEFKAREVTILTDAVDGHPSTSIFPVPGNGTNWSFNSSGTRATAVRGQDDDDEAVVLDGVDLRRFWKNWGSMRGYNYRFREIHLALATTMKNAGHSQDEICELFALHTPSGDCADLVDLSEIFDGPPCRGRWGSR